VADQLPDDLHDAITRLSEQGNGLANRHSFAEARNAWQRAWDLLPAPREHWEAATWLLTSIGDAYYLDGKHADALDPLQRAVFCPGGLGNPFLHLRLGQVQFELGDTSRARDELARAFMGGGDTLFEGEDPKYWRFIREILRPPANEAGR
jgi:tetratricopeptide (TPR) repeat protein